MTRFHRILAVALAAGALAVSGCRSTHTTIIEPERHDRPVDHPADHPDPHRGDRDHPPPPRPDDHR